MTSGLIHEHAPIAFTRASQPVRKRIAIAGCGVVGSALLRLLEQHGERSPYDVKSVLVRDAKRRRDCDVSERLLTTALDDFLDFFFLLRIQHCVRCNQDNCSFRSHFVAHSPSQFEQSPPANSLATVLPTLHC